MAVQKTLRHGPVPGWVLAKPNAFAPIRFHRMTKCAASALAQSNTATSSGSRKLRRDGRGHRCQREHQHQRTVIDHHKRKNRRPGKVSGF
jgi:hypothetical protein